MRWPSWLPRWFAVVVATALLAIGHGPLAERVTHHWPYSMLLLIIDTLLGFARRTITGASMRPDQPPNDHVRDANQRVLWQTGLGVAMLGIVLAAVWPSPRSGGFEATLFGLAMGSILLIGMSLSMRKRKPKSRHCPGFIVALVNSKGTVVNGQPVPVDWAVWDSTTHLYKIGSRWYDPQFGVRVKPLVTKVERVDVTLNRTYQAFAAHYGVAIVPARPRKPRDKGQKGLSMPARPYSISTTGRSRRCGSWAISTVSYDNYTAINAVPEAGGVERVQKLPGERGGDPIYA